MDPQELLLIAFRATFVYFATLVLVRLLGKREVGAFTAFDLVVSLIIGESVDEAIYGDVSLVKFVVLIGTVGLWHFVNSWASYKSQFIDRLTGAAPSVVVASGKIKHEVLAKERMNEEELWSELRLQGIDDLAEVKIGTMEPNGKISVIKEEWAREVQKGDLGKAKEKPAG